MADDGHIRTMLNGVTDKNLQQILVKVFEYLLKEIRFGRAIDGDASKNFGGGFFEGRTHEDADTEFSIEHSFGRKPYLAIQVLPLDEVNAEAVPLRITRAADSQRIYLSSSAEDVPFFLYLEG
jgi:hypothetical protein